MVKGGIIPGGGAMAHFAGRGVVFRDVVGIRGPFKILLMAGVTERGRPGVNSVRMAVGASGRNMGTGQRIIGLRAVIEARRRPGRRRMAFRASETERWRRMNWIGCAREIVMVAGVAIGRRAGVSLAVAVLTTHINMCASQGEVGQIMIETGVIPGTGAVAYFASGRKVARHMIGIGRAFVILLMAGIADC